MAKIIPPFASASDRGYKFLRVFDQYYAARGGRMVLYVEGGIAPYDWSVTGSDFTLDAAQTSVQYNFITVDAAAVLDNTEVVTITDANNQSVTITVCTCNPNECVSDVSTSDQNYTNFTEFDSDGDVTVTASSVAVSTLRRDATMYVARSFGADYFEDFILRQKISWPSSDDQGQGMVLGVSNASGLTIIDMATANVGLQVYIYRNGAEYNIYLKDFTNDNVDHIVLSTGSPPGDIWVEFKRSGTTATLIVYSDAYSTVIDTITITCGANTYEYLIATASRNNPSASAISITYTVSALQIVTKGFLIDTISPALSTLDCQSALVTVIGGCPPYKWEVTSGETTFDVLYTNSPSNRMICDNPPTCSCTYILKITDGDGNITTGPCPAPIDFKFNNVSTPDTIDPGGNITMYVEGGKSPYTWEIVAGVGYTLGAAETNGVGNTITSASGVCNTDYDPVVYLKVTDMCGSEVTFQIRNTGGNWSACNGCSVGACQNEVTKYVYRSSGCRLSYQCGEPNTNECGVGDCGPWASSCPPCGDPPHYSYRAELICGAGVSPCVGEESCIAAIQLQYFSC